MATETVQLETTDKELFQSAMADPPPETPVETPEETTQRERDERGRFVAAEPKEQPKEQAAPVQQAEPEAQPEPKDDAVLPSWRAKEIREARDAAEARAEREAQQRYALESQLSQMRRDLEELRKPKADPVNFFENPDQAFQERLTPIQEQWQQTQTKVLLNSSKALNIAIHGREAVEQMETALEKSMQSRNPEMRYLSERMRASDDPVGVAMQWYRTNRLVEETGGDPAKYRERVADELLKDPNFQKRVVELIQGQSGQKSPSAVVQLPPSLSKVGTPANVRVDNDEDMSDAALFRNAMRR